jgi:hypothetical protein
MIKNADSDTGLISERGELFRSKLIGDFHLLDTFDEKGTVETPKYYSKDVTGTVHVWNHGPVTGCHVT